MTSRPVIFISAVSKELHSARQLVANTLALLGYDADWQDIFGTETGDLKAMLRRRIDGSAGVIQLIGQRYGAEGPQPDDTFGRVSYTQYEALHARQQGKKVWYLFLDEDFTTDPCEPESEDLAQLQQSYRQRVRADLHLFHPIKDRNGMEATVLKLRDDLTQLRRRTRQWAALVTGLLILVIGGIVWLKQGQKKTDQAIAQADQKSDAIIQRYKQMEQALIKLADAEMHAKQFGEKLTPEELRQRAYTILENELGIAAGTLPKELPAFALELYNRDDTTLLMRARAAYALNKFAEAEKLFLEADAQSKKALENAQAVADKLRKERIESLVGAGRSAREQVHYTQALDHYRAAVALIEEWRDPLEWAEVQWGIAFILDADGKSREAEMVYRQILSIYKKQKGQESADVLGIRNNLALALSAQGKHTEAEAEHRTVLPLMERVLGAEHPHTLSSRNNLALALQAQGKHAEAEVEHRARIAIEERVLGEEHPATLSSRNNLAAALQAQGKPADAEVEHRTVLSIRERVLGVEHPAALQSRMNLALALSAQGKHTEAEAEHRAVLAVRERVLGPEHPDVLRRCYNLALCLEYQEKLQEALDFMQRVEAGRKKALEPEHRDSKNARAARERIEAKLKAK